MHGQEHEDSGDEDQEDALIVSAAVATDNSGLATTVVNTVNQTLQNFQVGAEDQL